MNNELRMASDCLAGRPVPETCGVLSYPMWAVAPGKFDIEVRFWVPVPGAILPPEARLVNGTAIVVVPIFPGA